MINFDNAATSMQKPDCVAEAVYQAIRTMGNSGSGAHSASLYTSRVIYETRELVAKFFHAEGPQQVAFTSNSTESLNLSINGLFTETDHVITTALEHNSVLRPLFALEDRGMGLSVVPGDSKGNINYGDIKQQIQKNTKAIVCTHASNLTGNLVDIEAISRICKSNGLLLVADVSQTAGVFPIDMQAFGIDVLCFTGHKGLLGPQGTGGLCVKKGLAIRPLKVGGSGIHTHSRQHPSAMPQTLEAGTLNGHGLAGLKAALEYIREKGIETIRQREMALMWRFYHGVREIPGVCVYGDFDTEARAPIVTLNIGDCDSGLVSDELSQRYGIAVRSGGHCAPLMHEALGTARQGAVRFSFSHFNTEEEIDLGIAAVAELAAE